jgi:hypothetical protein
VFRNDAPDPTQDPMTPADWRSLGGAAIEALLSKEADK